MHKDFGFENYHAEGLTGGGDLPIGDYLEQKSCNRG